MLQPPGIEPGHHREPSPELNPYRGLFSGRDAEEPTPDEILLALLQGHAQSEKDTLKRYQHLSDSVTDPLAAALMKLVIEDEERHHKVLEKLISNLQDALRWTQSDNAFFVGSASPEAGSAEHIEATREFIENEREDARNLREAARQSGKLCDGLFKLLLNSMALDSRKHEEILSFVYDRLKKSQ